MRTITRNGKRVQYLGEFFPSTPELMVLLDRAMSFGANVNFRTGDNTHYRYTPASRHCPPQLTRVPAPEATVHPDGTRVTTAGREGVTTGLYVLNLGAPYTHILIDGENWWNHSHLVTPVPFEEEPGDPEELAYDDMLWAARERADELGY